jgi:hypothetical protein
MTVNGYSFGPEELLLEIIPKKEIQVSIESETPYLGKKVLNF